MADLNGNGSLTTRYVRGDGVDQLLGRVDGNNAYWTLTDRANSVRDVLDSNGNLKDSLRYDGFGNIVANSETNPAYRGRYAYTGREWDAETSLQYNRARYYDATIGRWISQDPMGFDAGDANLYRYVGNHVTNSTDPSGLDQILQNGSTTSWQTTGSGSHAGTFGIGMVNADGTVNITFAPPGYTPLNGNVTTSQLNAVAAYQNDISGLSLGAQQGYIWGRLNGLIQQSSTGNTNANSSPTSYSGAAWSAVESGESYDRFRGLCTRMVAWGVNQGLNVGYILTGGQAGGARPIECFNNEPLFDNQQAYSMGFNNVGQGWQVTTDGAILAYSLYNLPSAFSAAGSSAGGLSFSGGSLAVAPGVVVSGQGALSVSGIAFAATDLNNTGSSGTNSENAPVRTTGQIHHPISIRVGRALDSHSTLRGRYQPRDPRFTTQAIDEAAHRGYQTWHRELDAEVVRWLEHPDNAAATTQQFEAWLRWRYSQPDLLACFPNSF